MRASFSVDVLVLISAVIAGRSFKFAQQPRDCYDVALEKVPRGKERDGKCIGRLTRESIATR